MLLKAKFIAKVIKYIGIIKLIFICISSYILLGKQNKIMQLNFDNLLFKLQNLQIDLKGLHLMVLIKMDEKS